MEQDHTGAIPELLKRAPHIKIVYTTIAQSIFKRFYQIDPPAIFVKGDDMTISLGNKTLHFIQTPWLHWPETISTFCPEEKTLFCCDAFGAFKTLPQDAIMDSKMDLKRQNVCGCSQKYFASVFNSQRQWVLKAIEKFEKINLDIKVLAPSHGPVLAQTAKETLDKWAAWSRGAYQKTVVIAYASMYGFTAKALDAIADGVAKAGGTIISFNLSEVAAVDVLTALVEAPALIIGVPTYEHEIFPKVADFISLLDIKKFSGRCAAVFGSFGWSGEATEKVTANLASLGFEMIGEPLRIYGSPTIQDLDKAQQLGKAVAERAFSRYNSK